MEIPAFLRNPVTLLSAVAGLIAATWFFLGWPSDLPRSPLGPNEKLDCISYSPFRGNEGPSQSVVVAPERIDEDLAKLASIASCVRTYSTGNGIDRLPPLAQKRGMSVILGVAISNDNTDTRRETARALLMVNANRSAIRALAVGNGVLSRGDMSPAELSVIIRNMRDSSRLPVTYADDADTWMKYPEMASTVDAITVNFPLYAARYPISLSSIAQRLKETRAKFASVFPNKEVIFSEAGWPSEGRMRDGARPSHLNQAFAAQELLTVAKAGNFRVHLYEAFDQPWRMARGGIADASMGIFDGRTRELKFRFGGWVRNHPYWFYQAVIGVMCALVIFAAGFLGARVAGPVDAEKVNWLPVAGIALVSGLTIGGVLTDVALQNQSFFDWVYSAFLVGLALIVPPVCASALIRRAPFLGFASLLDPLARNLADPLSRVVTLLLMLVTLTAIELALGLVFEPAGREIQYAALTAPVLSLITVALMNPAGERREAMAETAAAILLAGAVVFIFFSEGVWNWQALWFEALLLVLAWVLVLARGGQRK